MSRTDLTTSNPLIAGMRPLSRAAHKYLLAAALLAALLLATARASANTIYVDQSAFPGGDGQSWATAFNDPQDALDVAVAGDQIWVAAGTYLPTLEATPGDPRSVTFQLISGVELYGAFPPGGGDGTFGARDISNPAYETTLSGNIGIPGDSSDNAYHVVTGSGTDATAVLDGFSIADGYAHGGAQYGGGMYIYPGAPTVNSCVFRDNHAVYAGGGMYNRDSNPIITDCLFINNDAWVGCGGMFNYNSNPVISTCIFRQNRSTSSGGPSYGGAINNTLGSPYITECLFDGNTAFAWAGAGGGIYNSNSNAIVHKCVFTGNGTRTQGGAIHNDGGAPVITECVFVGNRTTDAVDGYGGAMSDHNSNPLVINSVFAGNTASNYAGAVYSWQSTVQMVNCAFVGNTAPLGGAIYIENATPIISSCTLKGNVSNDGGGVYLMAGSAALVSNYVLWGNIAPLGPELTVIDGSTLNISYSNIEGWITAVHSEVGVNIVWGAGMIALDPLFTGRSSGAWTAVATYDSSTGQTTFEDAAAGLNNGELVGKFLNPDTTQTLQSLIVANTATTITAWGNFASLGVVGIAYEVNGYRLTPASPCVDAGDDFSVPADVADLDGDLDTTERTPLDLGLDPRFADAAPPGGSGVADPPSYPQVVDMGAYESPADCNNNGILDTCDLDCGTPGGPCDVPGCGLSADCNGNGIPDECEPQTDCQPNGVQDICDIAAGTSLDCNGDGVPDECELVGNDCNANSVPDDCEPQDDCQANGVQDICDIAAGTSLDCNGDGIPDECELVGNDCNTNGIPDDCELDTDNDGVIDACDNCPLVFNPGQTDIDNDGVGDVCDNCPNIPNPGQEDANGDGIGDVCPCPQRGDMNDDGVVDGNDIALFVEKVLGG